MCMYRKSTFTCTSAITHDETDTKEFQELQPILTQVTTGTS